MCPSGVTPPIANERGSGGAEGWLTSMNRDESLSWHNPVGAPAPKMPRATDSTSVNRMTRLCVITRNPDTSYPTVQFNADTCLCHPTKVVERKGGKVWLTDAPNHVAERRSLLAYDH